MAMVELGPVQVSVLSFVEPGSPRDRAPAGRADPERYGLALVTGGAVGFSQRGHGNEVRVGPGDFLLCDGSQPCDSRALDAGAPAQLLVLHLPKTALPVSAERLGPLVAQRICATGGMPAVLARYLSSIATLPDGDDPLDADDGRRLGQIALDLAAAMLAAQADAQDRLQPQTRGQALLSRIEAFIRHNLGDPDLSPAVVAAHHHISLGYLHRIFRSRERTVAAEIRRQRIERCRSDLADPRLREHPIHVIAARWGFRHAADFSRAFRAVHGLSPSAYRNQAPADWR